jgi:hypothetical protein
MRSNNIFFIKWTPYWIFALPNCSRRFHPTCVKIILSDLKAAFNGNYCAVELRPKREIQVFTFFPENLSENIVSPVNYCLKAVHTIEAGFNYNYGKYQLNKDNSFDF